MSDTRLKKNTTAGRESRASQDTSRQPPEDKMVSSEERRRMFRSEWQQEALPTVPEIPGFHPCWLSTTSTYDPIHKRLRMGYTPVTSEDLPGFEHYKVKSGEMEGFISVNEMVLYKIPNEIYQEIMQEMHHDAPMDEQTKIKIQQDQLLNAKDNSGKKLGTIEGDGMEFDMSKKAPIFE